MELEESQPPLAVARHLCERTHTSMLVVTIREGEGRGLCSTTLKEMVKIIIDHVEERSVVFFVLNRESAVWKDSKHESIGTSCSAQVHRR